MKSSVDVSTFGISCIHIPVLISINLVTRIPLDAPPPQPQSQSQTSQARPPWIRPVRKKSRAANGHGKAGGGGGSGESEGSRHGSPAEDVTSPATSSALSPSSPHSVLGPSAAGYQRPGSIPLSATPSGSSSFGRAPSGSRGENLLADLRDGGPLGLGAGVGLNTNDLGAMGLGVHGMDNMASLGPLGSMDAMGGMDNVGMQGMDGMNGMGNMGMSSSALMTLLNDGSFDMNALFSNDFGSVGAATPASSNGDSGPSAMTGIVASP